MIEYAISPFRPGKAESAAGVHAATPTAPATAIVRSRPRIEPGYAR
jgi:hypothetical protein